MFGQFKSRIQCPDCDKISITFDPFSVCSLPIPQAYEETLKLIFVPLDRIKSLPVKIEIEFHKLNDSMKSVRENLSEMINIPVERLTFAVASEDEYEVVDMRMMAIEVKHKAKWRTKVFAYENQEVEAAEGNDKEDKVPETVDQGTALDEEVMEVGQTKENNTNSFDQDSDPAPTHNTEPNTKKNPLMVTLVTSKKDYW